MSNNNEVSRTVAAGLDLDAIEARHTRAENTVSALCMHKHADGARDWTMSIPARPNYDTDLLIGASLKDIPALIAEVRRLRAVLAAAKKCVQSVGRRTEAWDYAEVLYSDVAELRAAIEAAQQGREGE